MSPKCEERDFESNVDEEIAIEVNSERPVCQAPGELMRYSLHFKNLILKRQGQRDNHHKSAQETPSA